MSVPVHGQHLVPHLRIRGTQVSNSMAAPSLLHVSVLQSFNFPKNATSAVVDNYTVYTSRHKTEKDMIHVWAYINGDGDEGFACVLL